MLQITALTSMRKEVLGLSTRTGWEAAASTAGGIGVVRDGSDFRLEACVCLQLSVRDRHPNSDYSRRLHGYL